MLFGMILAFALETAVLLLIAIWLGRRIALHLKDNPTGVSALSENLWVPLLGKTIESPAEPELSKPSQNGFGNSVPADSRSASD
jgi:hypothetical protein